MRTRLSLLASLACLPLLPLSARAGRIGEPGPLTGAWTIQLALKEYEPNAAKPLTDKIKTAVTITDDSSGPVANVTLSGFDGIDNFTMNGKRYGKRFFLRTDSGDKAKFILGSCTIVKKTGAASTISGVLGQIDTASIGEARFTGKRAPI